ncbi:MAG: hypothetical protein D6690_13110 [Nitrospirae bacterium]|nr:MAG: hypothetical protein D6690_13110 [Nitrospirota bacterium]
MRMRVDRDVASVHELEKLRTDHLFRRAFANEPALMHDHDPIAHLADEIDIVGHDRDRQALLRIESLQPLHQIDLVSKIQKHGRFIQ